jgi:hypothetical protein
MQMVTGGISDNFSDADHRKSNNGRIISAYCCQSLCVLLEDEGQNKSLRHKGVQ